MSLLTSTQGTPERVWSALGMLSALGGRADRNELAHWLNPRFSQGGAPRPTGGEAELAVVGCAVSLGLVTREGTDYVLTAPPPSDYVGFADAVHDRLCSIAADAADRVLLEVFAWMSTEVDVRQATAWVSASREEFADAADAAIGGGAGPQGERRFNSTKLASWRRWMGFVGLSVELPSPLGFQPHLAERLSRELARSGLPCDVELPVGVVLEALSERMPYADGGSLYRTAMARRGGTPTRRVSRLLSVALRDLHDEGRLRLGVTGDATGLRELAPDLHAVNSVQTILLLECHDA